MSVMIPVSWGDLVDRITVLEIKEESIPDPDVAQRVSNQLSELRSVHRKELADRCGDSEKKKLAPLVTELRKTNRRIWSAENTIRRHERLRDFGQEFVEAARAVRRDNDHRVSLKLRIDGLLGSDSSEIKYYASH